MVARPMARRAGFSARAHEQFGRFLTGKGLRYTDERQAVVGAVFAKHRHFEAEDLLLWARTHHPRVSRATIYRTLELLEQVGMVTHTHLGHGAPTYHLATDADHVHLVCRDCGRVTEIGPDAIRPLITALDERHGFETDVGHLTVFGRCQECRPR
jgi:Fur family ferric uptake transcriptional regulator